MNGWALQQCAHQLMWIPGNWLCTALDDLLINDENHRKENETEEKSKQINK